MQEDVEHINRFYASHSGRYLSQTLTALIDQFWDGAPQAQNAAFGYPFALTFDLATRCAIVIASAQAVASSSSEALAISSPVKSVTMV